MPADPLLAALDDALEHPHVAHLSRGDRLALALWWLIERVGDEFERYWQVNVSRPQKSAT